MISKVLVSHPFLWLTWLSSYSMFGFYYHCRCAGVTAGQMYTYPARCWRKKRRLGNATDPRLGIYGLHLGKIPASFS